MGAGDDAARLLRSLPAVHELAAELEGPRRLAVAAARQAIEEQRDAWLAGQPGSAEIVSRASWAAPGTEISVAPSLSCTKTSV